MKKYILKVLIVSLFYANCYSQRITIKNVESRLVTHQGIEFIGDLKDNSDNEYAYSNWSNQGVFFVDGKDYYLSNINFNITTNSFESRLNRNQLFSYKNSSLDSVSINNNLYKKVSGYFYEVLLSKGNNSFLKKYDVAYQAGILNRLDGSVGKSHAFVTYKYLIKFEDEFTQIEFEKNSILSLVKDDFHNVLEEFIDKEKLSYRREKDIVKILEYIFKNSSKMI